MQNNQNEENNNNLREDDDDILAIASDIKVRPSFLLITIICLTIYFLEKYNYVSYGELDLFLYAIIEKHQFYRIITQYFIFHGIMHLLISLIILLILSHYIESRIGSFFTISYIIHSIPLISIIHISIIFLMKLLFINFPNSIELNFYRNRGISPLLLSLSTYILLFFPNRRIYIKIMNITKIRLYNFPLILTFLLFLFTPNKSVISHISGIIYAFIVKDYLTLIFIPRIETVQYLERMWLGRIFTKVFLIGYERIVNINKRSLKNLYLKEINLTYNKLYKEVSKNKREIYPQRRENSRNEEQEDEGRELEDIDSDE